MGLVVSSMGAQQTSTQRREAGLSVSWVWVEPPSPSRHLDGIKTWEQSAPELTFTKPIVSSLHAFVFKIITHKIPKKTPGFRWNCLVRHNQIDRCALGDLICFTLTGRTFWLHLWPLIWARLLVTSHLCGWSYPNQGCYATIAGQGWWPSTLVWMAINSYLSLHSHWYHFLLLIKEILSLIKYI